MCDFLFIPIFCGTYNQVHSLGRELVVCPRCHNNAIQSMNRRTWFTLYCVPIFPISRKRTLLHCDICRWEGAPTPMVQVNQEQGRHRNRDLNSADSLQGLETTATPQPRPEQFRPVPYSQDDYLPPPPPYTKALDPAARKNKTKKAKPGAKVAT
ncbi:hypothetical protein BX661DRAFT_174949 [Kickxella alabastrina]|uniref:uncharacterized protein n=1 Tax=Kickxella alabastrina TaxID=61397 RepID=UPI00221EF8EF|nr:uncharacterized protein BX661DRAFT_174949 [Kickxella alabastrina]KAI7834496.1 hypothetical protein BX661DRAFT_174949 [Kickxella alabastrina]